MDFYLVKSYRKSKSQVFIYQFLKFNSVFTYTLNYPVYTFILIWNRKTFTEKLTYKIDLVVQNKISANFGLKVNLLL